MSMSERHSNSPIAPAIIAMLYETHFQRVFRYIAIRIGNLSEAQRLTVDAFLNTVRNWSGARNGEALDILLFRAAGAVTERRLGGYWRGVRAGPGEAGMGRANGQRKQDDSTETLEPLERAETIRETGEAIRSLDANMQQVLALRFGGGLSPEQIGQVLRKSPAEIRRLQSLALNRLRIGVSQWAEELPGRPNVPPAMAGSQRMAPQGNCS